jgi:hypothetical protein
MTMFESINVWKRDSVNSLILYRCFRNLATGRFSVQSADFYRLPIDADRVGFLERNYVQLLADLSPEERSSSFATLVEAIEEHEREFRVE